MESDLAKVDSHVGSPRESVGGSTPLDGRRKRHTTRELDDAMTHFNGDVFKAAKFLGITATQLKAKLLHRPELWVKWSERAKSITLSAIAALNSNPETGIAECMALYLNETHIALGAANVRAMTALRALEERIEKGEKARLSNDPEFIKRHGFKCNERGEPKEEEMLRAQYAGLLAETRKQAETFSRSAKTKFEIEMLVRKQAGGVAAGRTKAKPGWVSKGDKMPNNAIPMTSGGASA